MWWFRAGRPGARLLFHPDAAHRVLAGASANYRKDNVFYSEIRSVYGDGLLTRQDAEWQRQKRFLQPLYGPRRVDGYAAAMGEQVQDLVQRWRSGLPGAGPARRDDPRTWPPLLAAEQMGVG
jgi:cytochrome P450